MENEKQAPHHNVSIINREHMHLTAIQRVINFDETGFLLEMEGESLSIEGEALHMEAFDAERQELVLTGRLTGLFYFKRTPKRVKRGLLGRG